jgi:hypothetical protein
VNYAQWANAEAFAAMMTEPAARDHMDKAARLAVGFDPHLNSVESVHHAGATA